MTCTHRRPRHAKPWRQRPEDRLKAIRADKNLDDKAKEEAQEKIVNEFYGKIKPLAEADLKEHSNDAIGLIALQTLLGMERRERR